MLTVEHQPSGLGWMPDGSMLVASMRNRQILRLDPEGSVSIHADLTPLCPGHLNDMVVDASGRAYAGNFGYDVAAGDPPAATVLVKVDPDGASAVVAGGLRFPNGSVITPDGHTLIVAETMAGRLTAFTIEPDGTLTGRASGPSWAPAPSPARPARSGPTGAAPMPRGTCGWPTPSGVAACSSPRAARSSTSSPARTGSASMPAPWAARMAGRYCCAPPPTSRRPTVSAPGMPSCSPHRSTCRTPEYRRPAITRRPGGRRSTRRLNREETDPAMEFGIFIQTFVPNFRRENDPDAEHATLMDELECAIAADEAGFKYVWVTEHHFLAEYSHLSANESLSATSAITERIHVGSGIFNPFRRSTTRRLAETVAMLDHLSDGRFEFGTGRGAGSHEILGFLPGNDGHDRHTGDLGGRDRRVSRAMFTEDEYQGYQGEFWSLPPRKVLPKPWGWGHPAMWYACGNLPSYEMAARKGLGVLGFGVASIPEMDAVIHAYKRTIGQAEPVGAFVNDNIMVTTAAFVAETRSTAMASAQTPGFSYLQSNVYRFHDTFRTPAGFPYWPSSSLTPRRS